MFHSCFFFILSNSERCYSIIVIFRFQTQKKEIGSCGVGGHVWIHEAAHFVIFYYYICFSSFQYLIEKKNFFFQIKKKS